MISNELVNAEASCTPIAALLISGKGSRRVEITDLSSGGFRLRAAEAVAEGDVVLRVAHHGDFPARILRSLGLDAIGRFRDPVLLM